MLVLLILLGSAEGDLRALGISIVAAVVPAIVYCWIILSLDRYEKEPLHVVAFAFGWGAVGAILFALVASLVFQQFVFVTAGADAASALSIVVGAPVIEEACKGLAILLLMWFYRHELDGVLDGLVYGALVGLGFAMTENILYFITAYRDEGWSGLGELFVIRAVVNGFGHAMYTGVIGAAIGWSRSRYSRGSARVLVPIAGYLIGVLLHMFWNAGILLIAAWQGDNASWFSVLIIEVPLFVIPPLVILYLIARRGYQHEREVLATQLVGEVELGVLSKPEYDELIDHRKRKQTMAGARRNGWVAWRTQRQFYAAAGDIAFRKHHVIEGQRFDDEDRIAIQESRAVLSRARVALGEGGRRPLA